MFSVVRSQILHVIPTTTKLFSIAYTLKDLQRIFQLCKKLFFLVVVGFVAGSPIEKRSAYQRILNELAEMVKSPIKIFSKRSDFETPQEFLKAILSGEDNLFLNKNRAYLK